MDESKPKRPELGEGLTADPHTINHPKGRGLKSPYYLFLC